MKWKAVKFTLIGVGMSVLGVAIILATFEPHGDDGLLLRSLFPLLRPVAALISMLPIGEGMWLALFYGCILLHWPLLGAVLDVVCWVRRSRASKRVLGARG